MAQPIEAVISTATSVVQVSAAVGGAGQALTATPSASIDLATTSYGGPVQYKVGAGAWLTLDREQGVNLPINLAVTAVLLRKATPVGADVPVTLSVNTVSGNQASGAPVPAVIVGTAAPSNADGRPDGTIYIQTA